jgi:predicted Rdx family selenoprotein
VAAELSDGHIRETDITLTPVHDGRFEIYVNGKKVYDRKESEATDFYPSLRAIRKAKEVLSAALQAEHAAT